jgi:predicted Zn-dependent peptidase
MQQYNSFTLQNGLRIIHLPAESAVVYCGFAVDAGTRDENPAEHGLAHFVEHNLFKGTAKRRARHILNRMETVGGELNAYTTKEETFLYSTCLAADVERAVELLSDLVFNSVFPAAELEKEREVVIDEIDSYEDNPSELIFDEFENLVFAGTALGHNILGDAKSLATFTSETCLSFTENFYTPDRMIFFLYGDVSEKKLKHLAEKYMASVKTAASIVCRAELPKNTAIPCRVVEDKKLHQSHVMIGSRACSLFDGRRTALSLIDNILGGPGMNSRLNIELREKRGLVYTVESNLTLYTDCGLFSVYFGCGHEDREKCTDLVFQELKKIRNNKLSGTQFAAAVKQFKGQICISADRRENCALSMGKRFLRFNNYENIEQLCKRIDALTAAEVCEAADELLDERRLFTLAF